MFDILAALLVVAIIAVVALGWMLGELGKTVAEGGKRKGK
jgi:hypothetical protein